MTRLGVRWAGAGRGWVAALVLGAIVSTGCAVFGKAPLDVPPGHRVVLGEVFTGGFEWPNVVLDIARDGGGYRHELSIDAARVPFLITLPPGRYQITRLRLNESGQTFANAPWFQVGVVFDVEAPAVYVGTIRIERVVFGPRLRVEVRDEYDRTVPALRAQYPGLPSTVERALARPS
jgi:hypothetical protein